MLKDHKDHPPVQVKVNEIPSVCDQTNDNMRSVLPKTKFIFSVIRCFLLEEEVSGIIREK